MNKLAEMQALVAVVDAGTISAAAEHLGLAKSAVSKRLSDLEKRLGARLLNRTTRRLSLTEAGAEFHARCALILDDVIDAEAAVSETDQALGGTVRISAPLTFGLQHLGPALMQFMAAHPDVAVDIDFNDRQVDLIAEGFDLGIRIAELDDSSLICRRIAPVKMVVCASPAYWEEHGYPQSPIDLRDCVALTYSYARQRRWRFTAPDGSKGSVMPPTKHMANNGSFLADAAASGAGIVRQPLFIAHRLIEDGRLQAVLTDYDWHDINVWAVYPGTRHVPHRVRALIDHLAQAFGDRPYWEDCL